MLEQGPRWLVAGMFCLGAATCGQKGPLELPDEQTAVWESVEAVQNLGTGDRKGRPYDAVPGRMALVWSALGEPNGLRA